MALDGTTLDGERDIFGAAVERAGLGRPRRARAAAAGMAGTWNWAHLDRRVLVRDLLERPELERPELERAQLEWVELEWSQLELVCAGAG